MTLNESLANFDNALAGLKATASRIFTQDVMVATDELSMWIKEVRNGGRCLNCGEKICQDCGLCAADDCVCLVCETCDEKYHPDEASEHRHSAEESDADFDAIHSEGGRMYGGMVW